MDKGQGHSTVVHLATSGEEYCQVSAGVVYTNDLVEPIANREPEEFDAELVAKAYLTDIFRELPLPYQFPIIHGSDT